MEKVVLKEIKSLYDKQEQNVCGEYREGCENKNVFDEEGQ